VFNKFRGYVVNTRDERQSTPFGGHGQRSVDTEQKQTHHENEGNKITTFASTKQTITTRSTNTRAPTTCTNELNQQAATSHDTKKTHNTNRGGSKRRFSEGQMDSQSSKEITANGHNSRESYGELRSRRGSCKNSISPPEDADVAATTLFFGCGSIVARRIDASL
jgi:hypothetical protein